MRQRPTALVTGATAGIGHAFARALADRGNDLVLVARNLPRLEGVAADLRLTGVTVEAVRADLTDTADLERVAARLRSADEPVDLFVNNAGLGVNHYVVGGLLDEELNQHAILTTAVLVLSHAAAPAMKERGSGSIINVSSVAGYFPLSSYSADKAWCTVFSEVLAGELTGSGVTVTALCPGFVRTEFHDRAGMDMSRMPRWMWLDADQLVGACLRDVRAGKVVSVPSVGYRLLTLVSDVVPRPLLRWSLWNRPGGRREGSRR